MTLQSPRPHADRNALPGEAPQQDVPAELPVEPDLGPVPPVLQPEDPGQVQPPL